MYNQSYKHKRNFKFTIDKNKPSSLLQNKIMYISKFFLLSVHDYNTVIREPRSLKQLWRAFTWSAFILVLEFRKQTQLGNLCKVS